MGFSTILLEKSESISTLTLNRPEARNAVDLVMREEIVAALDEIEGAAAVRVLIVTGAGEHFHGKVSGLRICVGAEPGLDAGLRRHVPGSRVVGVEAADAGRVPV